MGRSSNWMTLAIDSWALGMEASSVIAMRMTKLAAMDAAAGVEAQLMVAEKVRATTELQALALSGGLGRTPQSALHRSVAHYRRAVAKNRRRLSR